MPPSLLDALYGAPLPRKLELARRLLTRYGEQLLSMSALRHHLDACSALQNDVRLCMVESGMPAFCRNCAVASASGGCCSLAMTEENDAVVLLLNLLAGSPVEIQRPAGAECLFLGESGCSLRFKPFFCLNYLCRQLRDQVQPALLHKLAKATGRLLQGQYATEQFLLRYLHEFSAEMPEVVQNL